MPEGPDGSVGPLIGPGTPRISLNQLYVDQRGGGYTCPAPDYDGAGGAPYSVFVGGGCPMGAEWGTLIHPVHNPYAQVGVGILGASSALEGFSGRTETPLGQLGAPELTFGDGLGPYADFGMICPSGPRRVEPIDPSIIQQMVMERMAGRLQALAGAPDASGLFGIARSYNCSGQTGPPVEYQQLVAIAQVGIGSLYEVRPSGCSPRRYVPCRIRLRNSPQLARPTAYKGALWGGVPDVYG